MFLQLFGTFSEFAPATTTKGTKKAKASIPYVSITTCSNTLYLVEKLLSSTSPVKEVSQQVVRSANTKEDVLLRK